MVIQLLSDQQIVFFFTSSHKPQICSNHNQLKSQIVQQNNLKICSWDKAEVTSIFLARLLCLPLLPVTGKNSSGEIWVKNSHAGKVSPLDSCLHATAKNAKRALQEEMDWSSMKCEGLIQTCMFSTNATLSLISVATTKPFRSPFPSHDLALWHAYNKELCKSVVITLLKDCLVLTKLSKLWCNSAKTATTVSSIGNKVVGGFPEV